MNNNKKSTNEFPTHIEKVKEIMNNKNTCSLKELFMILRLDYPEVKSMRCLKNDIEKYTNYYVNDKNIIVCKENLFNDIVDIINY